MSEPGGREQFHYTAKDPTWIGVHWPPLTALVVMVAVTVGTVWLWLTW